MSPSLRHHALVLTASLLAVSCSDLPELTHETEHLVLGADYQLCQGDLDHYERVITSVEAALDTTLDRKIEVYIWRSREVDDLGLCRGEEPIGGCYSDGEIYAEVQAVEHELVHAVIDSFNQPSRFWSEGAAEALQIERNRYAYSNPSTHVDKNRGDTISYGTAGHFSRWLLETHGIEQYRQLLRSPKHGREAFETAYGIPFADAEHDYLEQAPDSYGAFISCDENPLTEVADQRWSESVEIDCASPGTYGNSTGLYSRRVVAITERGDYAISTSASQVSIRRCPDDDYDEPPSLEDPEQYGDIPEYTEVWVEGYFKVFDGEGTTFDLTPGRYEFVLTFDDFESRTAALEVSAVAAP